MKTLNVGDVFGRLTVKELKHVEGEPGALCTCSCGGGITVKARALLRVQGRKSCGCLLKESLSRVAKANDWRGSRNPNYKHGYAPKDAVKAEFRTWYAMRKRCQNQHDSCYHLYGARGISVCPRWEGDEGFVNFLYDMGKKPSPRHSIDRINVNGNYEPKNCRWATPQEQRLNQRRSHGK